MEVFKESFVRLEQTVFALVELSKDNHHVINALLTLVEDRFAKVDAKMEGISWGLNVLTDKVMILEDRMTGLEDRMTGLEDRMTGLEDRMTALEGRVTVLEDRMTALENSVTVLAKDIYIKLNDINEALAKIHIATRYEEKYQDLIKFKLR